MTLNEMKPTRRSITSRSKTLQHYFRGVHRKLIVDKVFGVIAAFTGTDFYVNTHDSLLRGWSDGDNSGKEVFSFRLNPLYIQGR